MLMGGGDVVEYSEIIVWRIKSLCGKRGITYNKLASRSGLKQSTVDNIVRGLTKNPRIMTLHKIANGLNMTISEFLDFKEMNDVSFENDLNDDEDPNAI